MLDPKKVLRILLLFCHLRLPVIFYTFCNPTIVLDTVSLIYFNRKGSCFNEASLSTSVSFEAMHDQKVDWFQRRESVEDSYSFYLIHFYSSEPISKLSPSSIAEVQSTTLRGANRINQTQLTTVGVRTQSASSTSRGERSINQTTITIALAA